MPNLGARSMIVAVGAAALMSGVVAPAFAASPPPGVAVTPVLLLARRSVPKGQAWRYPRRQRRAATEAVRTSPTPEPGLLRRGRLIFEDTRVTGQVPRQGAIQLIARQRGQLSTMVKERSGYRLELLRTVFLR